MIRHTSTRFTPRYDHTFAQQSVPRLARSTRILTLLPVRLEVSAPGPAAPAGEVRR